MLKYSLLLTTAAMAAPLQFIQPQFVVDSSLRILSETPAFIPDDPMQGSPNGVRFYVLGPNSLQVYQVGGFVQFFESPAIVGDTIAFNLTTIYGAHRGVYLVHFNDGDTCTASSPCGFDVPNVTRVGFPLVGDYYTSPGDPPFWGPSQALFRSWANDQLTVDVFGFQGGHAVETVALPYRNVIPEPATYLLTGAGLIALVTVRKRRHFR